MNIKKKFSLSAYGLRYRLKISVYLMSVLPLLICFYLISVYVLPTAGIKLNMLILICISIFIAASGFFVIRQIVHPIVELSTRAKDIAGGNIDFEIAVERHDEIGDLENALAKLTARIKDNMQDLKKYSEETKEINLDINRKLIVLSGLLQVASFISEGINLGEVLTLTLEKMAQVGDSDKTFLLLLADNDELQVKSAYGEDSERLLNKRFKLAEHNLFARIIKEARVFSLDGKDTRNKEILWFEAEFGLKNSFLAPILIHNKVGGLVGVGNNKGFSYKNDELKLIDIFIKQIVIAIENDVLSRRVKNLETKDALTGLYNESFIRLRLDEEIKRAIMYQRPCSFILFNIEGYNEFCLKFGLPEAESLLKRTAAILKESINDVDKAARFSDFEFAVVLPEKNKKQAQAIAETIKEKTDYLFKADPDKRRLFTLATAVTENPIDGVSSMELITKAKELFRNRMPLAPDGS